jgi:fructuronate reductase
MPDTPQRIACDTSQKLSIRFGETIKKYLENKSLSLDNLKVIPLVFALWLRYLMALDDNGNVFELNPDPLLDDVKKYVEGVKLGEGVSDESLTKIDELLRRKEIFGVDLFQAGLAPRVKDLFKELCKEKGSVRRVLQSI